MGLKADKHATFIKLFFINIFLLVISYGVFYREGFGADTISQHAIPLINIETWITYGRYFAYLFSMGLYELGINAVEHYHIFYIMFIVNTTLALSVYQRMFREFFEELIPLVLSTSLIFINGLFCESFMFPECFPGFSLAYLFSAIGAYLVSRKKLIEGLLTLLISALFYQAPVMIAVICIIGYLYFEDDMIVSLKLVAEGILFIIFGAGISFLTTVSGSFFAALLGDTPKAVNFLGIRGEIKNIIHGMLLFFQSGYRLLPPAYFLLIILIFAVLVFVISSANPKKSLSLFLIIIAVFGTAMILPRGSETPRLLGGLYAALAVILMASVIVGSKRKRTMLPMILVLCAFLYIQIISIYKIAQNHYKSNEIDLSDARSVYSEILNYERETGNTITKVAWTTDKNTFLVNEGIYYTCGQINERTLPLVAYSLLTYVSDGREYQKVQMDKAIYKKHFKGKDWSSFDASEQLVFDNDTLYWCVY